MRVIVVGAGIIGLSTAWYLRRLGAEVTIIDPFPALGASHAAAGMIAPAAEVVWGQTPLYPLMQASAQMYPEFAAEVASAAEAGLGFSDVGTLVCAGDRADLQALRELREAQSQSGFDTELITGSAARAVEPSLSPAVAGAVHISGDRSIDPRRVCAALLSVLSTGSGSLIRQRAAGLVRVGEATVGVEINDGRRLEADQVILCAGSTNNTIHGAPQLPLREVWGDVLRLRAPAEATPLLTRTIRGLVNGRSVYLVPRPDGEIVLGASSREDGRSGTPGGAIHRLLADGQRLVPGVLDAEITDITTRARPGSPDDLPMIGRIDSGCIVSTGYFRHGILLAPFGGRLGAELALGTVSDWPPDGSLESVSPHRFTTETTAGPNHATAYSTRSIS
ncbi:glycine oxidase [Brevibacterium iodinum ATCC 49514]|uniref:glycine oxidase n=1 Tax=Brevibacterium iodinum ATCC 49514 TaxID=1255616 RepID=A0A2H1III1_9MICO|nr:glycine oxidase ThiO [Brevibacterium iodinum]SMX75027.1 glycine oxidase [Brevibacterium iodinum ATCC 49514]